ncbi:unnamed protein product [Parnassius apollo]|uniref:(apollo) hypothetical protein n=1 Tax=Parnassius apollo TaxID=110799 RepID=A0A8S3W318_PARAO|nr:unnamed protein product [Parnassius apollo]
MSSSRPSGGRNFTDAELARYLNYDGVTSDSDGETEGSETEDYLEVKDSEQTDEDDEPMEVISTSSPRIESPVTLEESTSSQNTDISRDTCIIYLPQTVLRGKDRHVWSTKKPQSLRTLSSNIVRISRGPTSQCRRENDPLQCFKMFITDEIIDEVVQWTNPEIIVKQQKLFSH